jgi:hypothetical protein
MILLVKGRALALNGLIGLSAHVSIVNPLSRIAVYFIILLCLTPGNSTILLVKGRALALKGENVL